MQKIIANFDEDPFLENIMILAQKLRNLRLIQSEDIFFYLESQILFCHRPIRKVGLLDNHDSGKCHKIWANFTVPQICFV